MISIDYSKYLQYLNSAGLKDFTAEIAPKIDSFFANLSNGDFVKWMNAVSSLPIIEDRKIVLNADTVTVKNSDTRRHGSGIEQITPQMQDKLRQNLMQLHPWRKGPFELFGIRIDTEWRSDLKWQRLAEKIEPLKDRIVLDVGCGCGYHCFRMLGAGAKAVAGIDPSLLFCTQFRAINKYVQTEKASVLPLGIDDMPQSAECFDTVFSMGVLYHRRNPTEHIKRLKGFLKPGGQLVLETLIIENLNIDLLTPQGRYAKMPNVRNIPSCNLLINWLKQAGFKNAKIIDVTRTTTDEQRSTEWMKFESLADYLNKSNSGLTIEGHPAPIRAIAIANK